MRKVVLLVEAAEDLEQARDFYDAQEFGIGDYWLIQCWPTSKALQCMMGFIPTFRISSEARRPISIRDLLPRNEKRNAGCRGFGFAPGTELDAEGIN